MYRMIYQQVRQNGLGARAEVEPTPEDARVFALRTVREQYPDFQPELGNGVA
jgi:hypothetical protein